MIQLALDILVISDFHYIGEANHTCSIEKRKSSLGPVLVRKALQRLRHEAIEVDLIIILGDVVDNGHAACAENDLAAIAEAARNSGLPVLAVPGNHDGCFERYARIFDVQPGLHEINGYGFLLFHDHVDSDDVTTRPEAGLRLPGIVNSEKPGMQLIALQHNPIHPQIESGYPYMLTNSETIISAYNESGVILSLSGHYHRGQAAHRLGEMTCYTAPAACEAPFRFAHIQLRERAVKVHEHALQMNIPGLVDVHCHTEYAYCGTTVAAEKNIEIASAMGIHKLCIIEHAFQLYFDRDDAWSYRWIFDQEMLRNALNDKKGRMAKYRKFVSGLRNDFIYLGLEVDVCADGSLLLAEEDKSGWDLLVGAIHDIYDFDKGQTSQKVAEKLFLRDTEKLLNHPIQVLAHPFRFFRRSDLERPVHLYGTVAEMLAQSGVAGEVNFHTNDPDPRFVEECLARGVKIALGTDSHDLAEVGELVPHLKVLKQAGVKLAELPEVLYKPEV